jgi:hypothetical protein
LWAFEFVLSYVCFGKEEFIKAEILLITTREAPSGIALVFGRDTRAMRCGKAKQEKCTKSPRLAAGISTAAISAGTLDSKNASTFFMRVKFTC